MSDLWAYYLRVKHSLVASKNAKMSTTNVYSHPQALGQCAQFLKKMDDSEPYFDTAGSARLSCAK